MVPSWANQLLPQLLVKQFDTLPLQYRHIEHMHEGVCLKKQNDSCDSTEIFFSKLRSAGLNYNLPSFFTDTYCAGGIKNGCQNRLKVGKWPFGANLRHLTEKLT